MTTHLSDRAILVQLNVSLWTATKLDREISREVAAAKGAVSGSGRYHKSLLPTCHLLTAIKQRATVIRTRFYENTLPWGIKGTQILPSRNYMEFATEFRKDKAEFDSLVSQFVPEYPTLKAEAQQLLGASYKEADYPAADRIAEKFSMSMSVMPVPNTDFRVDIADEELQRIRQEVEAQVNHAAQEAMTDVWNRLFEKVSHLAAKLSDPSAVFRDTTVTHVLELCELLPRLNFADDPNLEEKRQAVEQMLAGHHPDTLRNNLDVRHDVATEAKEILDAMSAFMGAE